MANALSRKSYRNNHMAYKAEPLQDDLTYREHLISVLVQIEHRTRQQAIKFLKSSGVKSF